MYPQILVKLRSIKFGGNSFSILEYYTWTHGRTDRQTDIDYMEKLTGTFLQLCESSTKRCTVRY
jgi:hypothetical protein